MLLVISMPLSGLRAEELGAIGPTYPIAEESALETIMRGLRDKERSGELQRIRQAAIQRSVDSIKHPAPIDGIPAARARVRRVIDPTMFYAKAITTEEGQVIVPAGARINPLLITALTRRLVFFDGRDRAQTEAVRRLVARQGNKVRPILIAGSWYDLSKGWKTQVYYDQHGKLTRRFGVTAVPCVVSQLDDKLLLEEIPAKELQ